MPNKNRKRRPRKEIADNARTRIKDTIVEFEFGGKGEKKFYDCDGFDDQWAGRVDDIVGRVESALRFLDFCAEVDAEEDRRSRSRSPSVTFPIEDDTEVPEATPKSVPKTGPLKRKPSKERAKSSEKERVNEKEGKDEKDDSADSNRTAEAMTMSMAQRKLDEYRERINKRKEDRQDTSSASKEFKEIEKSFKGKKIGLTQLKDKFEKFESGHFAVMTLAEMWDKIEDLTKKLEDLTGSAEVEKGKKALRELENTINANEFSILMNPGKIDGMDRKLTQQLKEFERKYITSEFEERKDERTYITSENEERKERKERKDKNDGPMTEDEMLNKLEKLKDSTEGEEGKNALRKLDEQIDVYLFLEKKSMNADEIDDMDRKLTQQLKDFEKKYSKDAPIKQYKDVQAEYYIELKKYEEQVKSMPKTQWDSGDERIDWETWEEDNDVEISVMKNLKKYSKAIDEASARARRGEQEHEELQKMTRDVKEFNELISKAKEPKLKKSSLPNKNKDSPASSPPETSKLSKNKDSPASSPSETSKLKKDELQTKIKGELNLLRDTVNKLNEGPEEVVSKEHVEELKRLEDRLNPLSEDGKKVNPLKHDLQRLYGSIAPFKDKLSSAYADFTSIYSEVRSKPPRKTEKKLESNHTTELQQLKKSVKKAMEGLEDQIKASYEDQFDAADDLQEAKRLVNKKAPKDEVEIKDQLGRIDRKHKKILRAKEYKDAYEKASKPQSTARRGPKKRERSVRNSDLIIDLRSKYQEYRKLAKSKKIENKFDEKYKDYSKATYASDEKNQDIIDFTEQLKKAISELESMKSSKATVDKDLQIAKKEYKKKYEEVPPLFPKVTDKDDKDKLMIEFKDFPSDWELESVKEAQDQLEKVVKFFEKVNAAASKDTPKKKGMPDLDDVSASPN